MLRDVEESQYLDATSGECAHLRVLVISQVFWPSLPDDSLEFHPRMLRLLRRFSIWYSELKAPRQLEWKPWLGVACLEVELAPGCKKEYTVTPFQANLIMHFEGSDCQHVHELAASCHVAEMVVRKNMVRWVTYGLVAEVELGLYRVVPRDIHKAHCQEVLLGDEDHDDCRTASSANTGQVGQLYEPYIIGMLTNLGELSLDQVHNLLEMFVNQDGDRTYALSTSSLSALMKRLCHDDTLDYSGGVYSLRSREP
mmetsp:Transcript_21751/g.68141  ORF Transcript_21751/g.68141 Transcript_21751/m.68141 type:complete len:254 (+) Transcript_21751:1357-2118(+)